MFRKQINVNCAITHTCINKIKPYAMFVCKVLEICFDNNDYDRGK